MNSRNPPGQKFDEVTLAAMEIASFFGGEVISFQEGEIPFPWASSSESESTLEQSKPTIALEVASVLPEQLTLIVKPSPVAQWTTTLSQLQLWYAAARAIGSSEAYLKRICQITQHCLDSISADVSEFELTQFQWDYLQRDLETYKQAQQVYHAAVSILSQKGQLIGEQIVYKGKIYTIHQQQTRIYIETEERGLILFAENAQVVTSCLLEKDVVRFNSFADRLCLSPLSAP
jgi:hypothetical protein